jgi:hypothetical protein
MATAKNEAISKPLIQIDDEIREMTDEEYSEHLEIQASYIPVPEIENSTE